MYKPGTQLIMTDLWAAAAAHKLGFEVQSSTRAHTVPGLIGESIWVRRFMEIAEKWRITVTESGPNAAERFLPQVGDLIKFGEKTLKVLPAKETAMFLHNEIELLDAVDFVDRIIERNNTPFPQFSEVIEPWHF